MADEPRVPPVLREATAAPRGIPVLTEAVQTGRIGEQELLAIQAEITALTRDLADRLLATALREMEAAMFEQVSERMREDLPELVERVLREHLGFEG